MKRQSPQQPKYFFKNYCPDDGTETSAPEDMLEVIGKVSLSKLNSDGIEAHILKEIEDTGSVSPSWLVMICAKEGQRFTMDNPLLKSCTTLMFAALCGASRSIIDKLIENGHGKYIDHKSHQGKTALMFAAETNRGSKGALESVEALLEAGADPSGAADLAMITVPDGFLYTNNPTKKDTGCSLRLREEEEKLSSMLRNAEEIHKVRAELQAAATSLYSAYQSNKDGSVPQRNWGQFAKICTEIVAKQFGGVQLDQNATSAALTEEVKGEIIKTFKTMDDKLKNAPTFTKQNAVRVMGILAVAAIGALIATTGVALASGVGIAAIKLSVGGAITSGTALSSLLSASMTTKVLASVGAAVGAYVGHKGVPNAGQKIQQSDLDGVLDMITVGFSRELQKQGISPGGKGKTL